MSSLTWILFTLGVAVFLLSILLRPSSPTTLLLTRSERRMKHLPSCSVLVHSFDGYRRYWEGWLYFWHKYSESSLPWTVYFATESRSPHATQLREVQHLPTGVGKWGYRLRRALESIPGEYVLYMQEDMWLTDALRSEYLLQALAHASKHDLLHLKLQPFCHHEVGLPTDYNRSEWYVASHQPALWQKSFLLSTLHDNYSPFQHETLLNRALHTPSERIAASLCACYPEVSFQTFPYEDVSRQGQLREIGVSMLRREGLTFQKEPGEVMFRHAR